MGTFAVRYEAACRFVLMLAVIGGSMVLFTLRGAVVAGLFPSIAAVCATFRTWILDADRSWSVVHTFRVFSEAWRDEFPRANWPGYGIAAVWAVLLVDYRILSQVALDAWGSAASGVVIVVTILFAVFSLAFWVVRANFDEPVGWLARTTAQMIIARPACTLVLLALMFLTIWLAVTAPALAFIAGPPALIFAAVGVVYAFGRLSGFDVREPRLEGNLT